MAPFVCSTTFEWITRSSNLESNLKFTVINELILHIQRNTKQHTSSVHQYKIMESSQFPFSQKQVK